MKIHFNNITGLHHGYLIVCGKSGIKSAMQKYHRLAREVGLVGKYAPHSLRYAYCVDKIIELRDAGCNRKEATSLAANFLGHGDGRGRYVSMVYGKTVVHNQQRLKSECVEVPKDAPQ